MAPKIGVGFLFNTTNWFIGASTPNFIKENYNPTTRGYAVSSKPHLYFISGFQTPLSKDIILKPSILAKAVAEAPLAIDLAINFEINKKFRIGVSYRWDSAVGALIAMNFLSDFQAGYAYDLNINGLGKYAPSSNQFYIKYIFKKNKNIKRQCPCDFANQKSEIDY